MYEIEYARAGGEASLVLSADGDLIAMESEIPADALPQAVRDALEVRYPDAVIVEAESVQLFYYEVEVVVDGETRELTVLASGAIEDDERDDDACRNCVTSVVWSNTPQ